MDKYIKYKGGYKYQLQENYIIRLTYLPKETIYTEHFTLALDGTLVIHSGYAWDGPSGPTIDTKSSMRASLVHDVLYQMMRMGLLPEEVKPYADDLFYDICIEDGMWKWRAKLWHRELRKFGSPNIKEENRRVVCIAP